MKLFFGILLAIAIIFGSWAFSGWLLMLFWNWVLVGMLGVSYVMTLFPAIGVMILLSIICRIIFPKQRNND